MCMLFDVYSDYFEHTAIGMMYIRKSWHTETEMKDAFLLLLFGSFAFCLHILCSIRREKKIVRSFSLFFFARSSAKNASWLYIAKFHSMSKLLRGYVLWWRLQDSQPNISGICPFLAMLTSGTPVNLWWNHVFVYTYSANIYSLKKTWSWSPEITEITKSAVTNVTKSAATESFESLNVCVSLNASIQKW